MPLRLGRSAPPPAVTSGPPERFARPSAAGFLAVVVVVAFVVHGWIGGVALRPADLVEGVGRLGEFLADAFPPDLDRIGAIGSALLVTFEIALLGTLIGVVLSVPLAVAAARNTTPHRLVHLVTRAFISVCRTIPDLVWALIFVVSVGLGPQAGVLAVAVDVLGLCGRFFAESIEEIDDGVLDGLRAGGAPGHAVIAGAVLPTCLPSFAGTSMFAMESALRSSVTIGLVGAGGIGIELSVSMSLLRYDEALTIILAIFVVVLCVERISAALRRRIMDGASR
ncbi:phosphonate ABC transporter, permease protein PhnE [Pseudonocardia kunmingensis]|uniref:Phosphonate transport system permease protein n=1 Tax=Pseudonocardia kunmingensis TaxID=630975 RepID=A0A543DXK9_9PSEU|nr:phosphonate ABC transporter, permease protein PhnE [Pseudonocardia kunmingensis]TQM14062.1 phosphonate transport system permease protein [Pseudonocardia kunmingensis]